MPSFPSLFFIIFGILVQGVLGKILLLVDGPDKEVINTPEGQWFQNGVAQYERIKRQSPELEIIYYKNESDWQDKVCPKLGANGGVSLIVDLIYRQDLEERPRTAFEGKGIPYLKVDSWPTNVLFKGAVAALEAKQATNAFLIFQGEEQVNRGVHLILGNTLIRIAFLDQKSQMEVIMGKFDYRVPSAVVVFGPRLQIEQFIAEGSGKTRHVIRNITEWVFMFDEFLDLPQKAFNVTFPHIRGYYDVGYCCKLMNPTMSEETGTVNEPQRDSCNLERCGPGNSPGQMYLTRLGYILADVLMSTIEGPAPATPKRVPLACSGTDGVTVTGGDEPFTERILNLVNQKSSDIYTLMDGNRVVQMEKLWFNDDRRNGSDNSTTVEVVDKLDFFNETDLKKPITMMVGNYDPMIQVPKSDEGIFNKSENYQFRPRPLHFRIGIVPLKPWTYNDTPSGKWEGYCIDLAEGIAGKMGFTYDLIPAWVFGRRDEKTGRWDGLTGDLVHGKIDIAVAPFIMTSEREEFIDFVSPYYEQSGLLITMKKPVVKNSLFKFMTVLKPEVWLSIAGATIATGFMLWFLDKFSPYSAQNNPHKYKTFRKFTLKESFWFALTSFTPQGGGEPPKAFSGRTLVAAYWIFVVLMLATFTANLAAFLTVERMQSPIRNLEHLAAQSSVKYSVVRNSTASNFFKNMANAEDILYQMWRNLTLKAPSSAKQYIVWEYPIREMYIHIDSVIEKTVMVKDKEEGFQRAVDDEYYAFIHDAAQTRYEVYRNCNLTLIGEPFAESPYAIAVAQGNPLQDNISMAILQLQTARFFETLSARYWSPSCSALGDGESDGISLESLGGVFIATIIGLGIAFISLAIEVFTTTRKRRKAQIEANMIKPAFGPLDFYTGNKADLAKQAAAAKKGKNEFNLYRRQFLPEVIN